MIGLDLPRFLSGSVVVESIFRLAGHGPAVLGAGRETDIPVLMAVLMFTSVLVVVFNLLADIAYASSTRGFVTDEAPELPETKVTFDVPLGAQNEQQAKLAARSSRPSMALRRARRAAQARRAPSMTLQRWLASVPPPSAGHDGAAVLALSAGSAGWPRCIIPESAANRVDPTMFRAPPSLTLRSGSDDVRRDILWRTIYGGRISLAIGHRVDSAGDDRRRGARSLVGVLRAMGRRV